MYMGEVLIQVWLKSIDKQVNVCTKESLQKNFQGLHRLLQTKFCDENDRRKNDACLKMFLMER